MGSFQVPSFPVWVENHSGGRALWWEGENNILHFGELGKGTHTQQSSSLGGCSGASQEARDRQEIRKPHSVENLHIASSKHDSAPRNGERKDPEGEGGRKVLGQLYPSFSSQGWLYPQAQGDRGLGSITATWKAWKSTLPSFPSSLPVKEVYKTFLPFFSLWLFHLSGLTPSAIKFLCREQPCKVQDSNYSVNVTSILLPSKY